MILRAAQFAANAHQGQFRKYSNDPYIYHPMRVAGRVMLLPGACPERVAAAWLHDLIEDCKPQAIHVYAAFPKSVTTLVEELTNKSQMPAFRKRPRAERKAIDREHIAQASRWAKIVKLIDRIDNLREIGLSEPDFIRLYGEESTALAFAIATDVPVDDTVTWSLVNELNNLASTLLREASDGGESN